MNADLKASLSGNETEQNYQAYIFANEFDRKVADYQKAGKDPFDLLDPAKPDYAGNLKIDWDERSFWQRAREGRYGRALQTIGDVVEQPDVYRDIATTGYEAKRLRGSWLTESEPIKEAIDRRIQLIFERTGVKLQNPFRFGYMHEAARRLDDMVARGEHAGRPDAFRSLLIDLFNEKVDALATRFPDKINDLAFPQSIQEEAASIREQAQRAAAEAKAKPHDPIAGAVAEFGGDLAFSAQRDPFFQASIVFGPTAAFGRAALMRVATSGLMQGLFNAVVTALEQPAVQAWRARMGQEHGIEPALEDVGFAFVLGAIPGVVSRGLIELKKSAREALETLLREKSEALAAEERAKLPKTSNFSEAEPDASLRVNSSPNGAVGEGEATIPVTTPSVRRTELPPLPESATLIGQHPKTGDIRGVLRHKDIEDPIDVVWGEPLSATSDGSGIAKMMIEPPEMLADLPERLATMEVWQRGPNRIRLRGEGGRAVVRLDFDGKKKTWLLTAFDPKEKK